MDPPWIVVNPSAVANGSAYGRSSTATLSTPRNRIQVVNSSTASVSFLRSSSSDLGISAPVLSPTVQATKTLRRQHGSYSRAFALTSVSTRLRPGATPWTGRLERAGRFRARLTGRSLLHAATEENTATSEHVDCTFFESIPVSVEPAARSCRNVGNDPADCKGSDRTSHSPGRAWRFHLEPRLE
jgi:hypothetical protein